MKALVHLASELQAFFEEQDWGFCFIGGLALQRWGEPRLTTDVDVTLLTGFSGERGVINTITDRYCGRLPDVVEFALRNRVLLLKSNEGIGIDIALGGLPFEERMIRRSSRFAFLPAIELRTCSAEDLVVTKSFADRDRDWLDIDGILTRQEDRIEWKTVWDELTPLCELKEAPHILDRLAGLREDQRT